MYEGGGGGMGVGGGGVGVGGSHALTVWQSYHDCAMS